VYVQRRTCTGEFAEVNLQKCTCRGLRAEVYVQKCTCREEPAQENLHRRICRGVRAGCDGGGEYPGMDYFPFPWKTLIIV